MAKNSTRVATGKSQLNVLPALLRACVSEPLHIKSRKVETPNHLHRADFLADCFRVFQTGILGPHLVHPPGP